MPSLLVSPLQGQCLVAPAAVSGGKATNGEGSKTLGKTHPALSPCSRPGGQDHPTNPSWPGDRRTPDRYTAPCVAPTPALERVLAEAPLPPAHVPEHPSDPGQWQLTTSNMGLSKPLSLAGAGDARSFALSQGWGRRRAGNLRRHLDITHPHPSVPAAPSPETLRLQEVDGKIQGQSFRLSLKQNVCTLSIAAYPSETIKPGGLGPASWKEEFVRGRQP